MSRWIPRLFLLALTAWIGACWWTSRPIKHSPGVLVAEAPTQQDTAAQPSIQRGEFVLSPVASYHLRGRVLGTKRYHSGQQSELVSVDVAVGWGRMSDQAVLDQLKFTMGNRFFFYEWQGTPPLPRAELERSAANNHVLSATPSVAKAIGRLRRGQIVEMNGWLVDAKASNGFRWPTSRRRDDTGNGACELFLVEAISVWNQQPEPGPATSLAARP